MIFLRLSKKKMGRRTRLQSKLNGVWLSAKSVKNIYECLYK